MDLKRPSPPPCAPRLPLLRCPPPRVPEPPPPCRAPRKLRVLLDTSLGSTPAHLINSQALRSPLLSGCEFPLPARPPALAVPPPSDQLPGLSRVVFPADLPQPAPRREGLFTPTPSFLWNCSYSFLPTLPISA